MIEIKIDSEEIQKCIKALSGMPEKLSQVRKRANQEAGKIIRTGIKRGITRTYYVKAHEVDEGMHSVQDEEQVTLTVRGRRRSLKSFMMRPKKAPRKRIPGGYLEGAVRRGNMHKFSRGFVFGKNNLPAMRIGRGSHNTMEGLKVITGPSIAQLADNESVLPEVIERAQKRLLQQLRYWTGQVMRE